MYSSHGCVREEGTREKASTNQGAETDWVLARGECVSRPCLSRDVCELTLPESMTCLTRRDKQLDPGTSLLLTWAQCCHTDGLEHPQLPNRTVVGELQHHILYCVCVCVCMHVCVCVFSLLRMF